MRGAADIENEVFREKLNAARKDLIDLVVWQRHIREKMYLQAFGETMEDTLKRRFKDRHTIL